jgi:hypothetical protein
MRLWRRSADNDAAHLLWSPLRDPLQLGEIDPLLRALTLADAQWLALTCPAPRKGPLYLFDGALTGSATRKRQRDDLARRKRPLFDLRLRGACSGTVSGEGSEDEQDGNGREVAHWDLLKNAATALDPAG